MGTFAYIAGTSYSGSTLLSMILDHHPDVVSVGEMYGPLVEDKDAYLCSCGEPMVDCDFWQQVKEKMTERGFAFTHQNWDFIFQFQGSKLKNQLACRSFRSLALDQMRNKILSALAPRYRKEFSRIGARNDAFIEAVLEVSGKSVFVDATKDPLRPFYLERYSHQMPKVIYLTRDPRGYVASHMKNNNSTLESGIKNWNRVAQHCHNYSQMIPEDRRLFVRYEDICEQKEGELARIYRFLGVANVPLKLGEANGHIAHVIGNRMRLKPLTEIRKNESWREKLEVHQIEKIKEQTATFREQLGY